VATTVGPGEVPFLAAYWEPSDCAGSGARLDPAGGRTGNGDDEFIDGDDVDGDGCPHCGERDCPWSTVPDRQRHTVGLRLSYDLAAHVATALVWTARQLNPTLELEPFSQDVRDVRNMTALRAALGEH
jgi:hypothetical protein